MLLLLGMNGSAPGLCWLSRAVAAALCNLLHSTLLDHAVARHALLLVSRCVCAVDAPALLLGVGT